MSNMKELSLELEDDFESLNDTSMKWSKATWGKQVKEGRFEDYDGPLTFKHTHIYWFESSAHVFLAKSILRSLGYEFSVLFDTAMNRYAITTTYATKGWRD